MKVSELIEKLKQFPQEMRVVVKGYEGDWTEPDKETPKTMLLHLDYQEPGYCGEHVECGVADKIGTKAVIEDWECWPCGDKKLTPTWVVVIDR